MSDIKHKFRGSQLERITESLEAELKHKRNTIVSVVEMKMDDSNRHIAQEDRPYTFKASVIAYTAILMDEPLALDLCWRMSHAGFSMCMETAPRTLSFRGIDIIITRMEKEPFKVINILK